MSAAPVEAPADERLPGGFEVRVRSDVRRVEGGRTLLGGSPLRSLRLSPRARRALEGDRLVVADATSEELARRLLAANLADPVLDDVAVAQHELTVVVPVRDRPEQLERALAPLAGLRLLVVDDASHDPAAVAAVAARHGARVLPLPVNLGPAGARNAGLREVRTACVGFVDSDVQADTAMLLRLARHLADPRVALVGPLVRSRARSVPPRWFERYDECSSSLALGSRSCAVAPGAAVAWLPSACLVGRTDLLGEGFTEAMRVGEDVDLVWRLVGAGRVVRYEAGETAWHDARPTVGEWAGRKYLYGTGGAALAARHGSAGAVAVLSPAMAVAGAAVLLRRRWSLPVVALGLARAWQQLVRVLPDVPERPAMAASVAVRGLGWAVRQESALLLRHWWPLGLLALGSRSGRRALVSAVAVDLVVHRDVVRRTGLLRTLVARRVDDLAYGSGLWVGAVREREWRGLAVRVVGRRRAPASPAGR
ncbi:mycofactocin biosynthesis glycosyltransferase MftF [Nocardioides aurantiacus]|uniref:Mycofactocin system glycosyltransferase n=1 Tax=Nocardioides aurantiacus TaxID=86796 RepID=A0A3N2CQF3_9ACTN|nr:mycofactocin biosynthesis glycosyltransferase MftF [Nocardioides aurantiacus]ROR89761.1 mycofactocin system glycosyltransferase [Nocardioides aurantiacus]